MKVVICPTAERATALTARVIEQALRQKPDIALGLATGRTMEAVYAHLVQAHQNSGLDFAACRTFNLDEYVGIAPDSAHSYRTYMNAHLFSRVNIALEATHVPDGAATDLDARCVAYEQAIRASGGVGLQLLGLGENGHIGFNEPFSAFTSRTRVVTLDPATRRQNVGMFDGDLEQVPYHAVTMGVGTILDAHRNVMVVTGAAKASMLARVIEGAMSACISATALQMHADCLVIVDEAAAGALSCRPYLEHLMQHDPELKALLS
ncbi:MULTISPECIES: glucosamine-6-phosphate deaminase [Novacetimonas]|nr:glucosamine-6-phosphate deaminase [Novacetimonas hansenii]GAN84538.1 glucosamine-6-phosphate isomerase [Novacetimonas hansenii JCM 7643]GBQ52843.1 6-phosphogluconolactonase [Novacetimonas hansenii NRIC 0243]GEC63289.1 glucosamine-6-phosphate deaminase [Novacetimonas hansenii]